MKTKTTDTPYHKIIHIRYNDDKVLTYYVAGYDRLGRRVYAMWSE